MLTPIGWTLPRLNGLGRMAWWMCLGVLVLASTGCLIKPEPMADLRGIYSDAARYHAAERRPVIVIPGILGSKIAGPDGEVIWGAFGGKGVNPVRQKGAELLALPMEMGKPLRELKDGNYSNGALERVDVNLLFLPVQVEAYAPILRALGAGGFQDQQLAEAGAVDYGNDHFTCFQFDYDWRRSNDENAALLHAYILDRKKYVEQKRKELYGIEEDVQFDIVAHSMGGLLTRYMLRYGDQPMGEDGELPELNWAGAKLVRKAVLIGTPNAGSVYSLTQLIDGATFVPLYPTYAAAILGTYPSVYQLLPRARHVALLDSEGQPLDLLDPELWIERGWGLADPKQDRVLRKLLPEVEDENQRREIALDQLRKALTSAQRFQAALDVPAQRPEGLELILFAGDSERTGLAAEVKSNGKPRIHAFGPGDGTVPRYSAVMDERHPGFKPFHRGPVDWSQVMFLHTNHLGLTSEPEFTDNVLYQLLELR